MSINALMRWIKPHDIVFFDLLEASVGNVYQAAQLFDREIRAENPAHWVELRKSMEELEHKGDEITCEMLERLNVSFATPMEKEDIQDLAHALDDALDCMDVIAERLVIYRIGNIRMPMLEMSSQVVESCKELVILVHGLRKMSDTGGARDRIRYIKELENRSDAVYHTALGELFHDHLDPVDVVKWKEMLDTMERTMDAVDHAAHVVGATMMKNA